MKTVFIAILVCGLCGLAVCEDSMEAMKKIGDACLEENKASKQDFEDLAAGKLKAADAPESMKCTVKCFMEKHGVLDAAGTEFKADVLKTKIGDKADMEVLDKALAACKDLKGANPCDTAFQIMTCMWQHRPLKE